MSSRSRSRLLLALALVVAVIITGIVRGSAGPQSAEPSKAAVAAAFAGSPPALAALHARAGELLGGGRPTFSEQLRSLRGHPVVVMLWASWCQPCRSGFPSYQRVSVADGRQVGFLGVDVRDPSPGGADLLRSFPVSFPTWLDRTGAIARSLRAGRGDPETVFIDRRGGEVHLHSGPYPNAAALQRAIRSILLG